MSNFTLESRIQIRNDIAANWVTENPILLKGEIGIENDTRKFKIGDGSTTWNSLKYASAHEVQINTVDPTNADVDYDIGSFWINTTAKTIFTLIAKTSTAIWKRLITAEEITVVAEAQVAQKLKTARTIGITGDGTGSTSFDGSANASITLVLKNSGVVAGTYTKLTVDAKGIITAAEQLAAADIPELTLAKITDAGTAASKNVGTGIGNVVEVLENGKIDENLLPAIAISETFEVASQTEMLALNAQTGDVAVRTDENKCYILKQKPSSTLANWILLRTPTDLVLSVNGKTGAVVLTTSDVSEGTNLYYTEARATANFNANFASKSSGGLSDGSTLIHSTDTVILNGGNA
jgi:hypothetical protein